MCVYSYNEDRERSEQLYEILDLISCDDKHQFSYRDIKLVHSPESEQRAAFLRWTGLYNDMDADEITECCIRVATYSQPYEEFGGDYLISNPWSLKFNMDSFYDALEYPPDNDIMFE